MRSTLSRCRSPTSYKFLSALSSVFNHFIGVPCNQRRLAAQAAIVAVDEPIRHVHVEGNRSRYGRRSLRSLEAGNAEIHFNDLRRTLEAHRSKNRASVIRKVTSKGTPADFRAENSYAHPSLDGNQPKTRTEVLPSLGKLTLRLQNVWRERIERLRLAEKKTLKPRRLGRTRKIKPIQEYLGVNFPPLPKYEMRWGRDTEEDVAPWLKYLTWSSGDASSRLNDEIKAFETYMSPTVAERNLRETVVSELRSIAARAMPGASLKIYGSYGTGLYTPSSDIDLRLSFPEIEKRLNERGPSPTRPVAVRESLQQLTNFMRCLQDLDGYTDIGLVGARTPVGVTTHQATGLQLQITATGETASSDEYVRTYLAEYPALRPLYFTIKNALLIRDFADTFTGGLGSYSLFMALVAWLRLRKSQNITIWHHNNETLGEDLLDFLEFYASFDYYHWGLSIEPPRVLRKRLRVGRPSTFEKEAMAGDPILRAQSKMCVADEIQPYRLYLQDPANPYNDLGSKCYGIKHIRATFQHILARLRRGMVQFEQSPSVFKNGGLLESVIGGRFDWLEQRRMRECMKGAGVTIWPKGP
ncbi:hypothetical protein GP486_004215 [Trichoglossum hirsutum]|uniref:polynucleotide adenylyltransferase n=1 Tax=Trichoglossum hirsutum TaxID=265104 RepID=A0A9P8LB85_9PEZI|nr:hypothetical protein GP486_004215 [Trichoglossum hirsutum]